MEVTTQVEMGAEMEESLRRGRTRMLWAVLAALVVTICFLPILSTHEKSQVGLATLEGGTAEAEGLGKQEVQVLRMHNATADATDNEQFQLREKIVKPKTKPTLKVIFMSGQSNMVGQGSISATEQDGTYKKGTLEQLVRDRPEDFGMLKDAQTGQWNVFDDVWIAYKYPKESNEQPTFEYRGNLTVNYAGDSPSSQKIGLELSLGLTLSKSDAFVDEDGDRVHQPILLVKAAWGGKSLDVDFRPPSSGGTVGPFYTAMVTAFHYALDNLEDLFPQYSEIGSYDIAGFAWFQGYDDGETEEASSHYQTNLVNLIKDVRAEFRAPDMKVAVGVSGMYGVIRRKPKRKAVIYAQFSVSRLYANFKGNVATVETRHFYRQPYPESPSKRGFHWNDNAESYWLIGQSMARAFECMFIGGQDDCNQYE